MGASDLEYVKRMDEGGVGITSSLHHEAEPQARANDHSHGVEPVGTAADVVDDAHYEEWYPAEAHGHSQGYYHGPEAEGCRQHGGL